MALTSEFLAQSSQIKFTTHCNGDCIELSRLDLDAEAAANLATLIKNPNGNLIVEFKRETEPE